SDCGDEPSLVADTLTGFVDELIADYKAEQQRQAEIVARRIPYQDEILAHREAIARDGGSKDAEDWMVCSSGYALFRMLDRLAYRVSPRKLRLYGLACCQLIPNLEQDADC